MVFSTSLFKRLLSLPNLLLALDLVLLFCEKITLAATPAAATVKIPVNNLLFKKIMVS